MSHCPVKVHKKVLQMEKEFRAGSFYEFNRRLAELKNQWLIAQKKKEDLQPEARRVVNSLQAMLIRVFSPLKPSPFLDLLLNDSEWGHFFEHAPLLHAALLEGNLELADHLKNLDSPQRISFVEYQKYCERLTRTHPFVFFTNGRKESALSWLIQYQVPNPKTIRDCFFQAVLLKDKPSIDFWIKQGADPDQALRGLHKQYLTEKDETKVRIFLEKLILSEMQLIEPAGLNRRRM